ncbi:MAG TPA: histidine kinase [Chthoniobacteraceae bacterium]|jgi:signal transduction histidine kinase|nr:histidine kinase [Chthoniobacteraceae bacterium]
MSVPVDQSPHVGLPVFPQSAGPDGMLSNAAQRERLALAQKLHDTLCQSLTGIRLLATLAERKGQSHPDLAGDLSELRRMVGTACDDVHQLVEELRTPTRPRSHSI